MFDNLFNEIMFECGGGRFTPARYEELVTMAMDFHADQDKKGLNDLLKQLKTEIMVAKKTVTTAKPVVKKAVVKMVAKKPVVKKVVPVTPAEPVAEVVVKKPVVKKPVVKKVVAKKVVPAATETPATPEKPAIAAVTTPVATAKPKAGKVQVEESTEPVTEFIGLKVGDKINHPKNGEGEVVGFKYDKHAKHYSPTIQFAEKKSQMSPYVSLANKI